MSATLNTVDAVLKNFYLGPLQKQINDEVAVLEMFEKATVTWSGKQCVLAVHTARNTAVFSTSDGGLFAAAGQQTVANLNVTAKYIYGRFQVTGPTIASAKGGNARSFIGALNLEMGELVKDVRNYADQMSISGGVVKGFLCQKQASGNTAAAQQNAGIAGDTDRTTWQYDGDFTFLSNVVQGTPATWVAVDLIRMDTYNAVTTVPAAPGNPNYWISAADQAAGTVDIEFGTDAVGQSYTTADVAVDRAVAVVLATTANLTDLGTVATGTFGGAAEATTPGDFTEPVNPLNQVTGIFTNLASQNHFGLDRNDGAANPFPALQTLITVQDATIPGGRQDLTLPRMTRVIDEVYLQCGEYIDCMMISPLLRNKYTQLLQGHITKDASAAPKADGGFRWGDMAYGGIDIKSFRQVPNGMIVFLYKASWVIAELQKGEFADMDGRALSRVSGSDAYEGYYAWYWELVCQKPFTNAVMCGLTLT
jgi:hypothetical protein